MAFPEMRTTRTGFVSINADARFVTVRGRSDFFPTKAQNFAIFADKAVGFVVILHVFNAVFVSLIRACFAQRRKTLVNTISNTMGIEKGKILSALEEIGEDNAVRGEVLSLEKLARLSDLLC